MDERHGASDPGVDEDAGESRPAADPDYSPLQTEAGHASDNPVTGGAWPQPEGAEAPGTETRQAQFDAIDRRAEEDARREVRSRERSARK
jgi:hypothetical protein